MKHILILFAALFALLTLPVFGDIVKSCVSETGASLLN
jgi:hypothetical protein